MIEPEPNVLERPITLRQAIVMVAALAAIIVAVLVTFRL